MKHLSRYHILFQICKKSVIMIRFKHTFIIIKNANGTKKINVNRIVTIVHVSQTEKCLRKTNSDNTVKQFMGYSVQGLNMEIAP